MVESQNKELNLDELVELTKGFIKLADELYSAGKLTPEEYDDLTSVKKNFLMKAQEEKEKEIQRCF